MENVCDFSQDVNKITIHERITDAAWHPEGKLFVYATEKGKLSIRDGEKGQEKLKIDHSGEFIWNVNWLLNSNQEGQIIVYDWTPSVTVYSNEGKVVSPARTLDFDPCSTSVLG